ncbi:MAG: photosystem I reaction center subunit XII [Cyanosarcina radialis HA8281-LM2]|nr:photosystem I reaction center subunit XII [Cyanosarcina radialis HA8281-LM2]
MSISDLQVYIALFIALHAGFMAFRLAVELSK